MRPAKLPTSSGRAMPSRMSSAAPEMAASGVLSSWVTFAVNCWRMASASRSWSICSVSVACCSLSLFTRGSNSRYGDPLGSATGSIERMGATSFRDSRRAAAQDSSTTTRATSSNRFVSPAMIESAVAASSETRTTLPSGRRSAW